MSGDDKYVIAQFRHDAPMSWVRDLRTFLVKDELKYKYFQPERHRVQANKELWKQVKTGVERAEITIVDPLTYQDRVLFTLKEMGAEFGHDFDKSTLHDLTSDALIEDSPLQAAQLSQYDWLNQRFGIPREDFSTARIKRVIGGRRRDAIVTAARAHAMVSPSEKWELISMCTGMDMYSFPARIQMIRKLGRVFDVEHAKSVGLLNEFSDRIAEAAHLSSLSILKSNKAVVERKSEKIDQIQAADIAAGWAVDFLMLSNGDYPGLARQFAWVAVNGIVISG